MRQLVFSLLFLFGLTSTSFAAWIEIDTRSRTLTFYDNDGVVRTYPVAVPRKNLQWKGTHTVTRKTEWPSWTPSKKMLKRDPSLPRHIPGGPNNPLGARALYLGDTLYRIHGNNDPESIGRAVSSGCIRMRNDDVIELYNMVPIGTVVTVY